MIDSDRQLDLDRKQITLKHRIIYTTQKYLHNQKTINRKEYDFIR